MTSITMNTLPLSSSSINLSKKQSTITRRGLIFAKASNGTEVESTKLSCNENNTVNVGGARREVMFAAAAAAVCSLAGVAFAGDEPKAGTAEARKVYAPVCVSMPTARVCRN